MRVGDRVKCIRTNPHNARAGTEGQYYIVNWVSQSGNALKVDGIEIALNPLRFQVAPLVVPAIAPQAVALGRPIVHYAQVMYNEDQEDYITAVNTDPQELRWSVDDYEVDGYEKVGPPKKITLRI